MKDFVRTEIAVLLVKDWQLHGIDHAACGINDTAGQKPAKGLPRKCRDDLSEGKYADPAHGNVDHGGKPLGTGDPQSIDEDACSSNAPYQCQHDPAGAVSQNQHADWRVGSCNQNKDHHMIDLT